jgi:hypothetical protein
MVRVGRVQRHCCLTRCGLCCPGKCLEPERGPSPVGCWSAQIATLALHSIYSGQSSFDLRRQGLSDDVSVQATEVFADGTQKVFVGDR